MAENALTRDQITGEALNILKTLRDNTRAGKSNKLADVKSAFEFSVSIDFDTYFFFLRKFHFIGMDREACLQLTAEGEKVLDGERRERFDAAVQEYFANRITLDEMPAVDGQAEELEAEPESSDENGPMAAAVLDVEPARLARPPPPPPQPRVDTTAVVSLPAPPPGAGSFSRSPREERRNEAMAPPPAERPSDQTKPTKPPLPSTHRLEKEADVPPTSTPATPKAPRTENELRAAGEAKGQEIDLRYVKYDAMGQGPLGIVYRGRHTALGLDVCVKELKDIFGYFSFLQRGEVIKRLKKELCSQALVRHPNVAAILDQNCDVARPYFVIELCAGGSLRNLLDQNPGKPIAVERATRMFLQLCYGLRAAHAQGLTHGNLKPENVLLDHCGNAKLSDFGLSRVIEVDATRGMPQVFVGTGGMGYMSPEQLARSTKDVGPSSDVYALGILLYEMLTGQLPGRRSPLPSGVNADVPAKLDPLFDKMTQDRREARYPDLDSVLTDFYAAFNDGKYLTRGDLILSSEIQVAPPKVEPKPEA